jgi:hypothetical protein
MPNFGWFGSMLLVLICWGCAGYDNPLLSSGPHPRVEDCALIQQATPAKYVCNGKTYTSVQLADISEGKNLNPPAKTSRAATSGTLSASLPAPVKSNP